MQPDNWISGCLQKMEAFYLRCHQPKTQRIILFAVFIFCLLTRWTAELAVVVLTPPFMVVFLLAYILGAMRHKGLLHYPWVLYPWTYVCIGIAWLPASLFWSEHNTWWPLSQSIWYEIQLLGVVPMAAYALYRLVIVETFIGVHGFFADVSLVFVALVIFFMLLFPDYYLMMWQSTTTDNLFNRLEVPFCLYLIFLMVTFLCFVKNKPRVSWLTAWAIILFSIWTVYDGFPFIENIKDPLLQRIVINISLVVLDASVLFTLRVLEHENKTIFELAPRPVFVRSLRISKLIWVASGLMLLATPLGYAANRVFTDSAMGSEMLLRLSLIGFCIAAFAIFFRFTLLIFHANTQQAILASAALTDDLTQLSNRRGFEIKLNQLPAGQYLLLLLDLDRFKQLNDTHGHKQGDKALVHVAETLARMPMIKVAGRLGGDEFVAVLSFSGSAQQALDQLAERLRRNLWLADTGIHVSVSIGACFMREKVSFDDYYHQADLALYASKAERQGQPKLYVVQPV